MTTNNIIPSLEGKKEHYHPIIGMKKEDWKGTRSDQIRYDMIE
jgi:hypothetical protein